MKYADFLSVFARNCCNPPFFKGVVTAVVVVNHVECTELAAVIKAVAHEAHGPDLVLLQRYFLLQGRILHLAYIAEGACERSHLGHVPWPVLAPGTLLVLGIVHGENSHLVTVLLKQLLQVEHIDAVATATILELVGEKNFHIIKINNF